MNFEQINTFILVTETGSFSKAAEKLLISNVSVLKQIRSLEKEFSTTFFKCGRNGCTLTESGDIFLQKARNLQILYSDLEKSLSEHINSKKTIRLGYDPDFGSAFLMPLIKEFSDSPSINLEIIKCKYSDFFNNIISNIIDTAFVGEPDYKLQKTLHFNKVIKTNYYVMYRKNNLYFNKDEITLDDLKEINVYFSPIKNNETYDYFVKKIDKNHLKPISIYDFINTKTDGVYVTTGLSEKIGSDFELVKISDLESWWGVISRREESKYLKELIQISKKIFCE